MSNKKKLILYYSSMFLISILLFVFTTLFIIRFTILNKNYVEKNINDDYYNKVYIDIKRNMKNNMLSIHIDQKILDNIYTKKDLKNSVNNTLEILYVNYKNKIDTSFVENKLRKNINDYYKEKNIVDINSNGVDEFVNITLESYKQEFNIMNNVNSIGRNIQSLRKIFNIIIVITLIMLILLIVYLRKEIEKYFITPLFTYSILTISIVSYINSRIIIKYITIVSNSFSLIIRELVQNILNLFITVSIIYILIGIILIVLNKLLEIKTKKKKKRKTTKKKKKIVKKKNNKKKSSKK